VVAIAVAVVAALGLLTNGLGLDARASPVPVSTTDCNNLDLGRRVSGRPLARLRKLEPKAVEDVACRVGVAVDETGANLALQHAMQLLPFARRSRRSHNKVRVTAGAPFRCVPLVHENNQRELGEQGSELPNG
jgi:hypothetical protein